MITNDELKQKLCQVAEFRMPVLTKTEIRDSKAAKRGKGRSAEDAYQEEHEEVFLDMFKGINPTHVPELVKINIQPVDCEDCGLHCPEGRLKSTKRYDSPVVYWRSKCETCGLCESPSGQYNMPVMEASKTWTEHMRSQRNQDQRNKLTILGQKRKTDK